MGDAGCAPPTIDRLLMWRESCEEGSSSSVRSESESVSVGVPGAVAEDALRSEAGQPARVWPLRGRPHVLHIGVLRGVGVAGALALGERVVRGDVVVRGLLVALRVVTMVDRVVLQCSRGGKLVYRRWRSVSRKTLEWH